MTIETMFVDVDDAEQIRHVVVRCKGVVVGEMILQKVIDAENLRETVRHASYLLSVGRHLRWMIQELRGVSHPSERPSEEQRVEYFRGFADAGFRSPPSSMPPQGSSKWYEFGYDRGYLLFSALREANIKMEENPIKG